MYISVVLIYLKEKRKEGIPNNNNYYFWNIRNSAFAFLNLFLSTLNKFYIETNREFLYTNLI